MAFYSFENMGLVSRLSKQNNVPQTVKVVDREELPDVEPEKPAAENDSDLKPGEARIIRDEKGKVIRIEYGGEHGTHVVNKEKDNDDEMESLDSDEEDDDDDDDEIEDNAMADEWSSSSSDTYDPGLETADTVKNVTGVVAELVNDAKGKARPTKNKPTISSDEKVWLQMMIKKHGDDYKAMARDKYNSLQHSPHYIRKKIELLSSME